MCAKELNNKIESFEGLGSSINRLDIYTAKYTPIRGGYYISTPKYLQSKRCICNVDNHKEYTTQCLDFCYLAFKYPQKQHITRLSHYTKHLNEINREGIEYPVALKQVKKYANNNDVCINVYGWEEQPQLNGFWVVLQLP